MHRVTSCVRRIPPAQLPTVRNDDGTERPATAAEMLNMGLVPLGDDLYDCIEQERRDPGTLEWRPERAMPGEVVSRGRARDRYARLPEPARSRILRAHVFSRTDGRDLAAHYAELMERAAVPAEERAETTLARARERAAQPGYPVERRDLAVAELDAGDVIEARDLPPHRWGGESER
jgi:hypothetical protein